MKYIVDSLPMISAREPMGVGFYIYPISHSEFCRDAADAYRYVTSTSLEKLMKIVCPNVKIYGIGGELEIKDHDELLVVRVGIVNPEDLEEVDKALKNELIKFYRVRVRMAPLDRKCTAVGNNIDVYAEACRHYIDISGVSEALVFDL